MFNSRGKHPEVATVTSVAVDSGDSEDHLSNNSRRRQHKINSQAAEIATVKAKLNNALEKKNKRLKSLFCPEKMVEAMTKVVSAVTMQSPKDIEGHSVSWCL